MVRYHNKTLQIKIIQDVSYKPGATRARIQQLESTKLAEAIVSQYRHKVHMICLKKASTNNNRSKRRGLLPGNLRTTPGRQVTRCRSRHLWGTPAPGRQRLVIRVYKTKGEIKQG